MIVYSMRSPKLTRLALQVQKLTAGEQLFVNVGASQVGGRVLAVKGDLAKIALTAPACAQAGDKVALSRRIDKHWRLVGKYGSRSRSTRADFYPSLQDGERSSVELWLKSRMNKLGDLARGLLLLVSYTPRCHSYSALDVIILDRRS